MLSLRSRKSPPIFGSLPDYTEDEPEEQDVLDALDGVLLESDFDSSMRSKRYLRFIVDRVLGSDGGSISQLSFQAYYNAEKPKFGPEWSTRFQIQFLFPK